MNELYKAVVFNNLLLQQILYILISDEDKYNEIYTKLAASLESQFDQNKKEK